MLRADALESKECEAGVIASLIHHPEYAFFSENLLPGHFSDKVNAGIYATLCDLAKKEVQNIDAYIISEGLKSTKITKALPMQPSVEQIQELVDMSDVLCRNSPQEYKILVDNIMDAALRRDLITTLKECQQKCLDKDIDDISQVVYEEIDDVLSQFTMSEDIPVFSDMVDDLWTEVEAHQDGRESGIPFKFNALNEFVTLEKGELIVVAAPAKGGKSMFMLNEAVDLMKKGHSVMYIDSELSSRMFLCRMVSHLTGIEFVRVRSGSYSKEEAEKIADAISWIKRQKLIHIYMPIFDQKTVYTAVKRIYHRLDGLDVLIVDYLKSTGNVEAYATYAELGKFTDLIKNDICGAMGIAGLAAAQLTDSGKIADSAKIARNASTILVLTGKTKEEIDMYGPECGNKKLTVLFNRNGMQHLDGEWIDIAFNGNIISLEDAKQHIPEEPY